MEPSSAPEPDRGQPSWLFIGIIVLILAGFTLTAFYGVRVLRSAALLRRGRLPPGVTDVELIRGWMTVPYIARSYHVPEDLLWQGLSIPREQNRFKSLRTLDREYAGGRPGAILTRVKNIIREYESQHSPTPTPNGKLFLSGPAPGFRNPSSRPGSNE